MTTYSVNNPPPEFNLLSNADQDKLVDEVNRLVKCYQINSKKIELSPFKEYFLNIKLRFNLTSYRHVMYHALNGEVPVCVCGNLRKWNGHDYTRYCSTKCSTSSPEVREKTINTCMSRYGAAAPAQSQAVKDKAVKTSIERFGVEYHSQLEEVKLAKKETSLQKFGTVSPLLSPGVRAKSQETLMSNYGVTHPSQSPEIRNQTKQTTLNRYGVDNVFKSELIKTKIQETLISNYGVTHPSQSPEIVQKIKETYLGRTREDDDFINDINAKRINTSMEKYGVAHHNQRHFSQAALDFLENDNIFMKAVDSGMVFKVAASLGISSWPIYQKLKKLGITIDKKSSEFEREVLAFVQSNYQGKIIQNTRAIIEPKEIDIFLPEINLAIECNGSYWHSELNGKSKTYHLDKTNGCRSANITLVHIWEHDWIKSRDIFESMLLNKLGKLHKVYARQCIVKEVSSNEAKTFFNNNHLQGNCNSSIRIGLYHDNELISCMSFGKTRFNKKVQYEMLRFATKKKTSVVGGASKLFNYFVKLYSPNSVISYANRLYATGNVYAKLGFEFTGNTSPGYKYTADYSVFYDRQKFQKHKLAGLGLVFDPELTEWENMQLNNFDRIWDSGNSVFIWKSEA